MIFDTHLHLDLFADPIKVTNYIEQKGIYTIAVTNLPQVFKNTQKLCSGLKFIRPALGYHPELAFKYNNQIGLFNELVNQTRYIGEIGLDNYRKTKQDFLCQRKIFESIISTCAEKKNKILTIHSRRSEEEIISIIGDDFPGKIILHWYSGSLKRLDKALDNGYYFSINSEMVRSKNGVNIIKRIPVDRLLLESDSPFIGVNRERNITYDMHLLIKNISLLKDIPSGKINITLKKNFKALIE